MRTDTDLINHRVAVKSSIAQLGAALDAAEQACDAADARGDDPSNYDFTADDGSFQHDDISCPYCALRAARDEYFGAIRDAVVSRRDALLEWTLPAEEPSERRRARIKHCRKERAGARAAYALAQTAREKCDAAARVEQAESDFEVVFRKTVSSLPPRALVRAWLATSKRQRVAQEAFEEADMLGTQDQADAARRVLEDITLEACLLDFALSNTRVRRAIYHERRQVELRAEWDRKMAGVRQRNADLRAEVERFMANRQSSHD